MVRKLFFFLIVNKIIIHNFQLPIVGVQANFEEYIDDLIEYEIEVVNL
jgi:hypothetical protein